VLKVEPRPEPERFNADVREPGRRALAEDRDPLPDHWRNCLPYLSREYDGVCAYSCFYIPLVTGARSVEHFAPKSTHPDLAYEWSNYRLVCARMNSRKGNRGEVLDPFEIGEDWFELEFVCMQVRPAPHLPKAIMRRVEATINRLKLNDTESCDARATSYEEWTHGHCDDSLMERHAPFIYREAVRQGKQPSG
jgi:uncharacterized protein (TIGR02646 family)